MAGLRAGKDYVGVGVGVVVVNDTGQVFLSQRGEKATNALKKKIGGKLVLKRV